MPELLNKIPEQFREFWGNMDKGNKTKTVILSAFIFISIVVAIIIMTSPQYHTLLAHPDPREAREVIEALEKARVDYQVDNMGSIQVKKGDVNRANAAMLQEGLPRGGVRLADFTVGGLGTTSEQERRGYQEYKEKHLEATLREMDSIRNAVVKLSMPERSVFFGGDGQRAKASVAIDAYYELTQQQIKGIERFVASAVEDLAPEDVTILDNYANILNDQSEDMLATNINSQFALEQTVKVGVEKQVKDLLMGLADNVRVMANLNLDFDTLITNQEIYEPVVDGQGIIRSREERRESATNTSAAGGVPGTDSNIPNYPNEAGGQTGEFRLSDEVVNYEINRTVTQATKAIGKLNEQRSSIAVAMYYTQSPQQADENIANDAIPRTEIADIQQMVSAATGIPVQNVTVQMHDVMTQPAVSEPINVMQLVDQYGYLLLILVIITLLAIAILKRNKDIQDEQLQPAGAGQLKRPYNEDELLDIDLEEKSEVKKQIDKFVKQKPEAVAQLLRNWLSEDWD